MQENSETHHEITGKNPDAVSLGRLGGLKGGKARAEKLTPERRSEIARNASLARWAKREWTLTDAQAEKWRADILRRIEAGEFEPFTPTRDQAFARTSEKFHNALKNLA